MLIIEGSQPLSWIAPCSISTRPGSLNCRDRHVQLSQRQGRLLRVHDAHEQVRLPPSEVGGPHGGRQPFGELDHDGVPGIGSVRLVDQRERVDVQDRDPAGHPGRDRLGEATLKTATPRQAGDHLRPDGVEVRTLLVAHEATGGHIDHLVP